MDERAELEQLRKLKRLQELEAKSDDAPAAPASGPGGVEAFGQGLAQGGTLGYANEAQAATAPLVKGAMKLFGMDTGDDVDEKLKAQGFKVNAPEDSYAQRLTENKARDKELQKSGYYSAGQVAGSLLPGMLVPGGAAKTLAGKVAQAATAGGAVGALQNVEEGDSRLGNAIQGAALGGAGQGISSGILAGLKGLQKSGGALKDLAEKMAFKSTGAMLKDFRAADNKGAVNDIGRFMIDKGLVKPGDTFDTVAEKAQQLASQHTKILDDAYAQAAKSGESALFKTQDTIEGILAKAREVAKGNHGGQQAISKLENMIQEVVPEGTHMNAEQMRDFTTKLGKLTKWWDQSQPSGVNETTQNVMTKAYFEARNKINSSLDKLADSVGGSLGDKVRASNKELSSALNIGRIANDRVAREAAKNFIPLTDATLSGAGGTAGFVYGLTQGGMEDALRNAALGASLGVGSKIARKYARPIALTAADKMGSLLSPVGSAVAPLASLVEKLKPAAIGTSAAMNPWIGVKK